MATLIELVEATWVDPGGKQVTDTYELYEGEWVTLPTGGQSDRWYEVDWWKEHHPEMTPMDRCSYMVLSSGRYVGHWKDLHGFYEFLRLWMRATVTEVVFA